MKVCARIIANEANKAVETSNLLAIIKANLVNNVHRKWIMDVSA